MLNNRTMKFIRRIHLYSGIVLFLPVLLYGVTGFLFNHPTFFRSEESIEIDKTTLSDRGICTPGSKESMAAEFIALLERENPGVPIRLVAGTPKLSPRFSISGSSTNNKWTFVTDEVAAGTLRYEDVEEDRKPVIKKPKNGPFDSWREETTANVRGLSEEMLESTADKIRMRGPRFSMDVEVGDEQYRINHDIGRKRTTINEVKPREMTLRSFLLRLHLSHTYPADDTTRWIWAVLVDIMSGAMVFWSLSGLLMWYQLKRQRFYGGIFIVASLLGLALLASSMHTTLTN